MSLICLTLAVLPAVSQERLFADRELGGSDNGIVGKIDDELEVTPAGQLSYSIPIPAASGTGGIKPQLAISYSSSCKDGLFGYGFDLTGLSVISRVPSNRFLDGRATAVSFTADDNFALDGMRLVKLKSADTRTHEYRTVNNNFARIVARGEEKNPGSFTVRTKSGLVYEYSSNVSVLGGDCGNTIFWLVTKVSDTKGNYYTVSYEGEAPTNDFRVARIDYTGNSNAGLLPYASVRFSYEDNGCAPTTYIHGQKVRKSKRISLIEIYSNGKRARYYKAGYRETNRKHLLTSLTEYASDGTHKNPTRFSWHTIDEFKVTNIDYSKTSLIHKARLTVGDFNGDGKDDFIATPESEDAGWKGWKLFISRDTCFTLNASGSWHWPEDKVRQIVCGDFNGDGLTDVVVKRDHGSDWHNCDLYLAYLSGDRVTLNFSKCFLSLNRDYTIQPVEVNGDGATDMFIWFDDSKECRIVSSDTVAAGIAPLEHTATRHCSVKWKRVEFGDFNGDGLTDVLNLDDNGHCLLQSNGYGAMSEVSTGTWPERRHYIDFGDFNGDGKTDMLLTGSEKDPNKDGWADWCILYSKGDGTFEREYKPRTFDPRDRQMFIADINGDGFDDIHAVDKVSPEKLMTQPQVYLNDGTGNFHKQESGGSVYGLDKWRFYTGDFNGDGKTDFVCTSDWSKTSWDGYQLYLMPGESSNLLRKITDGLGNETLVTYKYLSDKTVCERGNTCDYPLVSCGSAWPVVSSVSVPDGIGGEAITSYRYCNALFHRNGLGFLCFEYVTANNLNRNTATTTRYEVDGKEYAVGIKSTQTFIGGTLVTQCDYVNTLSAYGSHVRTFLPTETHKRSYEYNSGALLSDISTTTEYDGYGNPTRTVTQSGDVTTETSCSYSNDETQWHIGRLLSSVVTKSNGNGSVIRRAAFDYDKESELLVAEISEPGDAVSGYKKTYTHDTYGNIVRSSIVPNDGSTPRTTSTTYTGDGRFLLTATNSLGFTQTNTIDEVLGVVVGSTDENGITTSNTYDRFGRLQQSATPVSKTVLTTGWAATMTDAPSGALYFEYTKTTGKPYTLEFFDCLGRCLRKVTEAVNGKKTYADCVYNAKGETERTSEPYFSGDAPCWNTNGYDAAGRTVRQTAPDGSTHIIQYDGLATTVTDPLGNTTAKTADLNGNLVRSVDSEGGAVAYKYDADGNCIQMEGPRTTMRMEYDLAGNRTRLDDPDAGISTDVYNAFGELAAHEDSHGRTTYTYDAGGRVTRECRPDMTILTSYDGGFKGKADAVTVYRDGSRDVQDKIWGAETLPPLDVDSCFESSDVMLADADGGETQWESTAAGSRLDDMTAVGAFDSGRSWMYDGYGRVIRETETVDKASFVTETSYNAQGLVETVTYPTGLVIKNGYAANGLLTSVSNAGTGKEYWRLNTLNARGQIEEECYGNGLATSTAYDKKRGLIERISTPGIQEWQYTFDAVGNLTSRRDIRRNLTESFGYDGLSRLTAVRRNGNTEQTISYDGAGNIVYKSDVGCYNYQDGTNRLSSISDCACQPMAWDEIRYNSFGKITLVRSADRSMTIAYGYDGRRRKQVTDQKQHYYINRLFERITEEGDTTDLSYIYGLGKLVAIVEGNPNGDKRTRFVHHDHLGSIQALSDEGGSLFQELSYDAWGRRRNADDWTVYELSVDAGAWHGRGFGGHEHIDGFEMINMDGRMYDPVVGRFLSPDPYVQMPDLTQSLNRYVYCVNNPLSLVDPSGYSWFSKNWKIVTASVVGIAVSVVTYGAGSGVGAAIVAGAAGGAAGALTGALLNGSNIGQIAKSTFTGALWGGASGFLNFASGSGSFMESLLKHAFSQGWLEGIQGGSVCHGFMMGAVSKAGGTLIDTNLNSIGECGEVVVNSILSGTLDELGGGKFANGAITGAFSIMFNDMMHKKHIWDRNLKEIFCNYKKMVSDFGGDVQGFYDFIGGPLGEWAASAPQFFQNTCATKLSYALNYSGYEIPACTKNTYQGKDGKWYFVNARQMSQYLEKTFILLNKTPIYYHGVKNAIVFQTGFTGGVSGHLDVVYRKKAAGKLYKDAPIFIYR